MSGFETRVRLLDEGVANQIAAGEVVERPASVLKELIENSLDAGAARVTVDLEEGGVRLVRVRDDGGGIHPDDLRLALSRHGTSKIGRIEDLVHLQTYGFRGEALASIASVSRLTIRSRVAGEKTGWELRSAGQGYERVPAAIPAGTEVAVHDLFYNTPARRKFLRAERTELAHLASVVKNAALSAYRTGFVVRHGQRVMHRFRVHRDARDRGARVAEVLGAGFMQQARLVDEALGDLHCHGWVAGPGSTGTVAAEQHFFLNGRPVRDATVRHALVMAFEGVIPAGHVPGTSCFWAFPRSGSTSMCTPRRPRSDSDEPATCTIFYFPRSGVHWAPRRDIRWPPLGPMGPVNPPRHIPPTPRQTVRRAGPWACWRHRRLPVSIVLRTRIPALRHLFPTAARRTGRSSCAIECLATRNGPSTRARPLAPRSRRAGPGLGPCWRPTSS